MKHTKLSSDEGFHVVRGNRRSQAAEMILALDRPKVAQTIVIAAAISGYMSFPGRVEHRQRQALSVTGRDAVAH